MADLPLHLQGDLDSRYRIERELGRGGMATVYLARDLRHGRPVALKVIRSELVTLADLFVSEIRLTASLQHPHILPLLDSGTVDGGPLGATPWYVMPYVEGESLRRRLEREHQLPLDDALAIARGVAAALACAHAHGVIHRDIKTGEHPALRRRSGRSRLRPRPRRVRLGPRAPHQHRSRARHAGLHEPGAGGGRPRRR